MTHDYIRHGTMTLFAALNALDGRVIGRNMQRHRHQEFIRFLNQVEAAVPAGKMVHAVVDNYANDRHPKVRAWLVRHPRWTFLFSPTSAMRSTERGTTPSTPPQHQSERLTPYNSNLKTRCARSSFGRLPPPYQSVRRRHKGRARHTNWRCASSVKRPPLAISSSKEPLSATRPR